MIMFTNVTSHKEKREMFYIMSIVLVICLFASPLLVYFALEYKRIKHRG